jgi:hypothetical protein
VTIRTPAEIDESSVACNLPNSLRSWRSHPRQAKRASHDAHAEFLSNVAPAEHLLSLVGDES